MEPGTQLSKSQRRGAGILLHPTCLPGPFGIGDLGPAAETFLEWAAAAGQSWWQVLPLGPTGYGDSPYGALSSFAGNPLLVSPEVLVAEGLLPASELDEIPRSTSGRVNFATVRTWKGAVLRASFEHFRHSPPAAARLAYEAFLEEARQAGWLEDWALYSALKDRHQGRAWNAWPAEVRGREPAALDAARSSLGDEIPYHRYAQFLFFYQWDRLRRAAAALGISLMGDLPIYVALDSADVWAAPDLFELNAEGQPTAVSGVPPDYFSTTGQLWGTPLYRWVRHRQQGYAWWVARVRANLRLTDLLRLDHFRGFEAYWRVPAGEKTAEGGSWVPGPGQELFDILRRELGQLPLVAEDLGYITEEVRELVAAVGLPSMKVLQFAFSEPEHLPHNHPRQAVIYTGTHDNDTTRSWFAGLEAEERRRALDYLGSTGRQIEWDLIRAAYTSPAFLAVVPLQDVLGLGSKGRMNYPGREAGNWSWRVKAQELKPELAGRLRRLAEVSQRLPAATEVASR